MIAWFKKYWKIILCVLLVIPAVAWGIRWLYILFRDPAGPNFTDLERGLREDLERMEGDEKKVLEMVIKERDEMWKRIDQGEPSAADIFNRELGSDE
ncbi:MAG: hypothetical protein JRI71_16380 [Deltaproteobacteria bacterium]|nr:hypothetical protein [Deltaproteobacteria bacterium]